MNQHLDEQNVFSFHLFAEVLDSVKQMYCGLIFSSYFVKTQAVLMAQGDYDSSLNLKLVFDLRLFLIHLHLNMPRYVGAIDSLLLYSYQNHLAQQTYEYEVVAFII
ncbi:hypothetical protein AVENLUH5627_01221 [Acinetobacter venetianus]|uniref:Uncharacterized protein n=1 Tax=Acinetobacter venetianus TaxID=52133 RepID=A0A150HV92_9GAMM|nr:hypothetical protein AVENLUH5627_01221 [Acinetobacter venetianus]